MSKFKIRVGIAPCIVAAQTVKNQEHVQRGRPGTN